MLTADTAPSLKHPAIMQVLHDWSDVKALEILTEVHKAIGHTGATLVIMETSFIGALSMLSATGAIVCCS